MSNDAPENLLSGPLHFNAVVRPHRSLSRKGFVIVMSILAVVNFGAGIIFLYHGAWPVFGFCGLDVALVYWAFRANYRAGNAYETVQVSDDDLLIRRVDPRGRVEAQRLQPYWAQLELVEEHDGATHLFVRSHGKRVEVAAMLSPEERMSFMRAFSVALGATKTRSISQA
jgi:uncharacterized membrane protein